MHDSRRWLITGCSTGFGRSLATRLLERGERVVMTARDAARIADLAEAFPDRAIAATLDVTNASQVTALAHRLRDEALDIDVLVNNAGYALFGGIEEATTDQYRAIFETNYFGALAMIRAVLPGMRARRRGYIVNISSMAGISGGLAMGHYAATKFALAAISEALALEIAHLGIKVTIVEPGAHRTAVKAHWQVAAAIEDYALSIGRARALLQGEQGREPGDPERVATAIIALADLSDPPLHLPLGRDALARSEAKTERTIRENALWRDLIVSTTA